MIILTGRDTGRTAYVYPEEIVRIEPMKETVKVRSHPFTRIFLQNEKEHYDYFLDVKESKKEIEAKIRDEKK